MKFGGREPASKGRGPWGQRRRKKDKGPKSQRRRAVAIFEPILTGDYFDRRVAVSRPSAPPVAREFFDSFLIGGRRFQAPDSSRFREICEIKAEPMSKTSRF